MRKTNVRVIVSASYRIDIPAFYAPWFLARLRAGCCRVVNPYGGGRHEVSLAPGNGRRVCVLDPQYAPLMAELDVVRRVTIARAAPPLTVPKVSSG
jgi:Domain of unknown function (DUF1848)